MPITLLDPKNDYVFKRLFADAPALLADLISAVRHDCPPVREVQVLNPRIEPADLRDEYIVLDLLARDATGRHYNLEMQVRRYHDYSERDAYYLANTLAAQFERGEDYAPRPAPQTWWVRPCPREWHTLNTGKRTKSWPTPSTPRSATR